MPHMKLTQQTGSRIMGGNDVIHDFWYLGKGDEGDKILKFYTNLGIIP